MPAARPDGSLHVVSLRHPRFALRISGNEPLDHGHAVPIKD
jgi:hypothetical protein